MPTAVKEVIVSAKVASQVGEGLLVGSKVSLEGGALLHQKLWLSN